MTHERTNSTLILQSSPFSSPAQFGRRAFGPHRRMSPDTVARNIAESIITHRELGQDRPISFYTDNRDTQALVQAKLDTHAMTAPDTPQPGQRYRRVSH